VSETGHLIGFSRIRIGLSWNWVIEFETGSEIGSIRSKNFGLNTNQVGPISIPTTQFLSQGFFFPFPRKKNKERWIQGSWEPISKVKFLKIKS